MRTRMTAVGVLALVAAGQALAQPAILDRIPATSALIVVTGDMQRASARAKPLTALLGGRADMPGDELLKAAERLMGLPGVKKDGSLAMVMPEAPSEDDLEDAPEPSILVLAPVTDYAGFVAALGGTGPGVSEVEIEGRPVWVRDLGGGVALLGGPRGAVEGYRSEGGNLEAHKARLGAAGRKVADEADVAIIADAQAFKQRIETGEADFGVGRGLGGVGALAGQIEGPGAAITNLRKALARDGRVAVIGMTGSEAGYALDIAGVFAEGSESAKMFEKDGDSASLMARLPSQPFYLAGAFDMSAPGVRSLMTPEEPARDAGESVPTAFDALSGAMRKADGMAVVVGSNKAGPLAGIFLNTVAYISTKESRVLLGAIRENGEKMKETTLGGTKVKVEYKKDVAEASGVKFDAWATTIVPDPNDPNAFMAGMMMQTLFGQSRGFGQMAAATDGGLIMTMSQNTPLMSSAIEAATSGKGLGNDAGLAVVRANLPASRSLEMYLGTQTIMDAAIPMLEDYLGEEIAVPKNIPPVGMAGSMEGGSMTMRVFVPMGVVRAAEAMMKAMKAAEDDFEPMNGGT